VPVVRSPIFEKHEREGLDPPDIYPHPDDVIINEATGEVTIDGPISKEQAGARKAVESMHLNVFRRAILTPVLPHLRMLP